MIEATVFDKIADCVRGNIPVALVTVIDSEGSSPAKKGAVMAVWGDGNTEGTVGGGNLEYVVIKEAIEAMISGKEGEFSYQLDDEGDLGMTCGGEVRVFIKVFSARNRLVIIGAGHIGLELYKFGLMQGFSIVVVDDRADFASKVRFPEAETILNGDLTEMINKIEITGKDYIAIATRSHKCDEEALRAVAGSAAAYIGMIGSRSKVTNIMTKLSESFEKDVLEKIYAPMGLDIASVDTREIALSIISEIMLVKNKGSLHHMKELKGFKFSS
jgi:xanthine dehydrogenase accessory factor